MSTIHDTLIISSLNNNESPLVVGIANLGLKLTTNKTRFLIGAKRFKLLSHFSKTIRLNLGCRSSTFHLNDFDLRFLNLGTDLIHLFLKRFDLGDIAHEPAGFFERFFSSYELSRLCFLIGLCFDQLGVEINFLSSQFLRFVLQHLNRLLELSDLFIGLGQRRLTGFEQLSLFRNLGNTLFNHFHVGIAKISGASEDDG